MYTNIKFICVTANLKSAKMLLLLYSVVCPHAGTAELHNIFFPELVIIDVY
jgi:hypothetical protein